MSEEGRPKEETFLASEYYFYLFPENSTQAHNVFLFDSPSISLQNLTHVPFPTLRPLFFKTTNLYIHRCGASTGAWLVNRPGTTLLKETDFPVLGSHQPSLSFSAKGEGLCVPSSNHTGMTGLIFEFTSAMIPLCPEDTVSPHLLPMSPHAGVQEWRVPRG